MNKPTFEIIQTISKFQGEDGIFEMPPTRFIGIRHNHLPGKEGRKNLVNLFTIHLVLKCGTI